MGQKIRSIARVDRATAAVAAAQERQLFDFTQLRVTLHGHVALLTMDAPPVNALTRTLNDELTRALDTVSEMDDARVVVLTGAGRTFCAGADLKARSETLKGPGDMSAHSRRSRECFHAIREGAKPVIAAVNGVALGAGLAMAASADILLASEHGALGLPEVDVGLLGGARHAMRLFGHSRTRKCARLCRISPCNALSICAAPSFEPTISRNIVRLRQVQGATSEKFRNMG